MPASLGQTIPMDTRLRESSIGSLSIVNDAIDASKNIALNARTVETTARKWPVGTLNEHPPIAGASDTATEQWDQREGSAQSVLKSCLLLAPRYPSHYSSRVMVP